MRKCTLVVDRCQHCRAVLGWFEGESYCPDCSRWTVTEPEPLDLDAVLLAVAVMLSEEEG
jgi:uncharacterized Zn finger protein (UPF0148 family)